MTIALMALAGIAVGFVFDAIIARLAREWYELENDGEGDVDDQAAGFNLASETGAIELPALLDGKSWYRRVTVVALTAGAYALLGWQYGGDALHLAIVSAYTGALIICSGTDLLAYRVPNVVTYPAIIGAFIIGMTMTDADRLDVALGGLVFGGLLFVLWLLSAGAMGMGIVKLALFVGFALGLSMVIPAMILTAAIWGAAAVLLLVTRVRGPRDPIAFAQFVAAGAFIVMLTWGTAFVAL